MLMPSQQRWLEVEQIGDVTVVRFTQPNILEEDKIQALGQQLLALVQNPENRKFLVNFGDVESVASTMVGKLFALQKRVQAAGGRVVLCGVKPDLYEVFDVLKITRLFKMYDDEAQALQSF